MRAAGQVEPKSVGRGDSRYGRPAPDGVKGQPREQLGVRVGLRRAHVQLGGEHARVGGRHADANANGLRIRTGRDHRLLAPHRIYERKGADRRCQSRNTHFGCVLLDHAPEWVLGRFRAPAELAHGRLPVDGQRHDFGRHSLARALAISRPTRAGTPATPARNRAVTGIIIDRRLEPGARLKPRDTGLFQPPEPLDGELRQEQRGDPSHRSPLR